MRRIAACVLAALALTACGSPDAPARTLPSVDSDALPTSYRMELHARCGERQLLGDYRLVVRHDRVVRAGPASLVRRLGLRLSDFPTLADLVDKAHDAEPDSEVDLRLDHAGVPRSLRIDHDPRAIDDEECYRVTRVRRLRD